MLLVRRAKPRMVFLGRTKFTAAQPGARLLGISRGQRSRTAGRRYAFLSISWGVSFGCWFLSSLLSARKFGTGWLSNAQFPEDLVAQTLSANVRFDALHPLQFMRIARTARIHLFVICPCSSQFLAFLRIKIPPIKLSAEARTAFRNPHSSRTPTSS